MRSASIYAPPAYSGIGDASPLGYQDQSFDYVYDIALTVNQRLLDQVATHNDADFAWRGVVVNFNTGAFAVRFSDSQWYWLSSGMTRNANLQGDAASPYPVFPEIIIPAGGRIGVDIQDLSGLANTVQILFRGVKRYRIAGVPGL